MKSDTLDIPNHPIPYTNGVFSYGRWSLYDELCKYEERRALWDRPFKAHIPMEARQKMVEKEEITVMETDDEFYQRVGITKLMLIPPKHQGNARFDKIANYGNRLAGVMVALRLTCTKLGKECGMNHSNVIRSLKHNRPPSTKRCRLMMEYLSKELDYGLTYEDLWPGQRPPHSRESVR